MVAVLHILIMAGLTVALIAIICWLVCQIISFVRLVLPCDDDRPEDLR